MREMDGWHALDEAGLGFTYEKRVSNGWRLRTAALDLGGGRLLVIGPVRRLGDAAHEALAARGRPAFLLAPNHFHHLGLSEWQARYPDAVAVAAPAALPRLSKQCPVPVASLEDAGIAMPAGVDLVRPEGTKNGETWLVLGGGAPGGGDVWVVCDAFFNAPVHPTGLFGLGCRLTGTTAGLRIGATWRHLHLADRRRYRDWLLARLDDAPPGRLVPGHGDPVEGPDLAERLGALAKRRL
jgi:hypothetical protein